MMDAVSLTLTVILGAIFTAALLIGFGKLQQKNERAGKIVGIVIIVAAATMIGTAASTTIVGAIS